MASDTIQAGFPTGALLQEARGRKQIVVAMLDGDFTGKRLRRNNDRVFLESGNDSFPPIEVSGNQKLVIWGVVTFVIHQAR